MATAIIFSKSKAESFIESIRDGKPIEGGPWTKADILALGGACFFAAMSHGPALCEDTKWDEVHAERQEAIEETLFADIHAAIEFQSHLTMLVADGKYDETCQAIVGEEDGKRLLQPVEGFRLLEDGKSDAAESGRDN